MVRSLRCNSQLKGPDLFVDSFFCFLQGRRYPALSPIDRTGEEGSGNRSCGPTCALVSREGESLTPIFGSKKGTRVILQI